MLTKLARENHRHLGLIFFICGLLVLSLFFTVPATAQRPYSYEGYLRTIAQFRTDVAHIGVGQQKCTETVDSIADQLEQITLIEMPNLALVAVDHQVEADALRKRPCSPVRADQILSGLCPERMCPVSRPVPRVPPNPGTGGASGDDGSLVGVGGGSGSGSGAAPPPGGGLAPPPGGGQAPPPGGGQAPGSGGEQTGPGGAGGNNDGSGDASVGSGDGTNGDGGQVDGTGGDAAPGDQSGDNSGELQVTPSGANGSEGDGQEQLTPTPSPTPSPTPTPTATPTPSPVPANAADTPEDEEQKVPPWVFVVAIMAIALMTGAAVLLLWPSDEEEMERKKKRKMAGTALSEGRKLVEEGDYRQAVRRLFLATLLTLDEKGLMRYDTTQTNHELLQEERIRPSLIPALSPIVGAYERVWYGLQPLPTQEYDLLVKRIKEIQDWRIESDPD